MTPHRLNRRRMIVASGLGMGATLTGQATAENTPQASSGGKAKSTILFFLCGGASHIDTWDMKPDAPAEYRGEFKPIATTAQNIQLCEHLPLLSQQAHHLALIRSIGATVNTNDHHAGYYHNLTGHVPDRTFLTKGNDRTPYSDDWPYMGTVVAAKRPKHELPAQRNQPASHAQPKTVHSARPVCRSTGNRTRPAVPDGQSRQPTLKFTAPSPGAASRFIHITYSVTAGTAGRSRYGSSRIRRRCRRTNVHSATGTSILAADLIQNG